MGRRVKAGPYPGGGQHGRDHRGRAPFAFRPRDMHDRDRVARDACQVQTVNQPAHSLQPELKGRRVAGPLVIDQAVKVRDRGGVIEVIDRHRGGFRMVAGRQFAGLDSGREGTRRR